MPFDSRPGKMIILNVDIAECSGKGDRRSKSGDDPALR
jgi:hypothetical protein